MKALIKRHLLNYIRDRWAVFFSFLSVIIILALFAFFLGNILDVSVPESLQGTDEGSYLVYGWILSGILVVTTVTVPLGFLHVFLKDLEQSQINDFYVSPLNRKTIVISYMVAAALIGFILSMVNFVLSQIILFVLASNILPLFSMLQVIALTMLSTMMFTAIFFYVVTHLKTMNAHANLATLVGTLVGFLCGLYVPIGNLSSMVQTVINALPFMQMASLMRLIYMDDAMNIVFASNHGALSNYQQFFGIEILWFNQPLSMPVLLIISIMWTVVFMVLSFIRLNKFKIN